MSVPEATARGKSIVVLAFQEMFLQPVSHFETKIETIGGITITERANIEELLPDLMGGVRDGKSEKFLCW